MKSGIEGLGFVHINALLLLGPRRVIEGSSRRRGWSGWRSASRRQRGVLQTGGWVKEAVAVDGTGGRWGPLLQGNLFEAGRNGSAQRLSRVPEREDDLVLHILPKDGTGQRDLSRAIGHTKRRNGRGRGGAAWYFGRGPASRDYDSGERREGAAAVVERAEGGGANSPQYSGRARWSVTI